MMTSDSYERAGLNSYRFVFAFAGQLIVSGTALSLALFLGKGDQTKGFQYTLILFAVISFILFMISVFPGILYMSCAILLIFYKIDQSTCIQMQEELDQRRAASE